ncbi:hypothetical protein D3C81_1313460 [compost metagenome]
MLSGNSCSRESIQRTRQGSAASKGTRARPTWPAPNTAICAWTWPMGSNSSTVAPPQHWPRLAPRLKRSRCGDSRRSLSICRAIFIALYSRWPPPIVSNSCSVLTTIFEPALRGVEPRSSMMVTSTQASPRACRSARALIQVCIVCCLKVPVLASSLARPAPTRSWRYRQSGAHGVTVSTSAAGC